MCTQLASFEKDYTGTHGQQNIKFDIGTYGDGTGLKVKLAQCFNFNKSDHFGVSVAV